ncbi:MULTISPECIES: hypothetical protein [Sphingomonas]|uniref:hypothetical protein n=1 Tax=Sphingomonas TaxID=13687 RepID=UPI000AC8E48B|nr:MULTISPECIES: hypothetical protein [Sphingomonas]
MTKVALGSSRRIDIVDIPDLATMIAPAGSVRTAERGADHICDYIVELVILIQSDPRP